MKPPFTPIAAYLHTSEDIHTAVPQVNAQIYDLPERPWWYRWVVSIARFLVKVWWSL